MTKVTVYKTDSNKKESMDVDSQIFGSKINEKLLTFSVNAYYSNKRQVYANTKTRSEVRGGGSKPWRQKGTGRARAGSNRSPIWQGGGITFGPTKDRNFKKTLPKKFKEQSVISALSSKMANKKIVIVDKISINKPKTKDMVKIINSLPIVGTIIIVLDKIDNNIIKASKNIPYLSLIKASDINSLDILRYNYLLITKDAIRYLEKKYSKVKKTNKVTKEHESVK